MLLPAIPAASFVLGRGDDHGLPLQEFGDFFEAR
jgi:hypothetical protein